MKKKIKGLLTDSVWSIAGLVLMNVIAQFVVYPIWNLRCGSAVYGDILVLISMMNIVCISMGSSCNYARMARSAQETTENDSYIYPLTLTSILLIPAGLLIGHFSGISMVHGELPLFILLSIVTMWRFYADVEYKLSLNYKGFFFYYLTIGVGYLAGAALFWVTGLWPLALLPGEMAGLILVWLRGSTLKFKFRGDLKQFLPIWKVIVMFFLTDILSYFIFNVDRIALKYWVGNGAVTIYYLASLLGKTMSLLTTPLNGVLIGYLVRYREGLNIKTMNIVTLCAGMIIILATTATFLASHIVVSLLYPNEYEQAKEFFLVANLSQVIYFVSTMVTVTLLRFSKARYQIYVTIVYALGFCIAAVPLVLQYGIAGFCWGVLAASLFRLGSALALGYKDAVGRRSESDSREDRT